FGCWFFFFSSRRRHTRFSRDWSSDVCSSDLRAAHLRCARKLRAEPGGVMTPDVSILLVTYNHERYIQRTLESVAAQSASHSIEEIGRASCREREAVSVEVGMRKRRGCYEVVW